MTAGRFSLFRLFCIGATAHFAVWSAGTVAEIIAIENVTVIDVSATDAAQARIAAQTVLLSDGRIHALGPASSLDVPTDATRIDGRGRFLIPALWDMHVHVVGSPAQQQASLLMFVANGVVAVREMGHDSSEADYATQRAAIERGHLIGPRIIAQPFRITDGIAVLKHREDPLDRPKAFFLGSPADARALVDLVTTAGHDFVKTYDSLSPEVFAALMQEAGARGLPVSGHVPVAVPLEDAANAGFRSLEHARTLPFACAQSGIRLRQAYALAIESKADLQRAYDLHNDPDFLASVIGSFDAAQCDRAIAHMQAAGMFYVPTHVTRRLDAFAALLEFRNDPRLRYVTSDARAAWAEDVDFYAQQPLAAQAVFYDFYMHGLRLTGRAHAAGIPILAGSDASDTHMFPGFTLHQELEELVKAGLSPQAALAAATWNAASFAGKTGESGSIAAGKRADLLLLDRDPLLDIAATRGIATLFYNGRMHDRAALDAMLARAESLVAAADRGTNE